MGTQEPYLSGHLSPIHRLANTNKFCTANNGMFVTDSEYAFHYFTYIFTHTVIMNGNLPLLLLQNRITSPLHLHRTLNVFKVLSQTFLHTSFKIFFIVNKIRILRVFCMFSVLFIFPSKPLYRCYTSVFYGCNPLCFSLSSHCPILSFFLCCFLHGWGWVIYLFIWLVCWLVVFF